MTKKEIQRMAKLAKKQVFSVYMNALKEYGQMNRGEAGALSPELATALVRRASTAWHAVQKAGMYVYSDALATA